jgi:hypothetical protein
MVAADLVVVTVFFLVVGVIVLLAAEPVIALILVVHRILWLIQRDDVASAEPTTKIWSPV